MGVLNLSTEKMATKFTFPCRILRRKKSTVPCGAFRFIFFWLDGIIENVIYYQRGDS
jgi:hypothetical protein